MASLQYGEAALHVQVSCGAGCQEGAGCQLSGSEAQRTSIGGGGLGDGGACWGCGAVRAGEGTEGQYRGGHGGVAVGCGEVRAGEGTGAKYKGGVRGLAAGCREVRGKGVRGRQGQGEERGAVGEGRQ